MLIEDMNARVGNNKVTDIDYFITNMKTSKVIQDIRVYRSFELDSDHYLLCAKVNFPPWWLNNNIKKVPVKQEEFFKIRHLNNKNKVVLQGAELYAKNVVINETDVERERENLQTALNSAAYKSLGTVKRRNRRKYLKMWNDKIQQEKKESMV